MSMDNFQLRGYVTTSTYSKLSKTSILFALIKTTAAAVFRPIIMFF